MLKLTPPSNASDNRPKVYRFVEAVKVLPTSFTASEIDFIFSKINPRLCGHLRSLFVCLSDDEFRKKRGIKFSPATPADQEEAGVADDESTVEVATEGASDASLTPSATPATVPAPAAAKPGRGPKRGASSPPDSAAPIKK